MMKVLKALVFFSALLHLAVAAPAAADFHNASQCVPWFHEPGIAHYGENGRVANEDYGGFMTLTCPQSGNESYGQEERGSATAVTRDNYPYANVVCSAYRQLATSNSRSWVQLAYYDRDTQTYSTPNVDDSIFRLQSTTRHQNWRRGGVVWVDSVSVYYFHYVTCRIPPKWYDGTSALASYSI